MAIQAQLYVSNLGFPLCGSQPQDLMTDFQSKQKHEQQGLQQLYKYNEHDPNLLVSGSKACNSNHPSMPYSHSLAAEFQNQRNQVDHYIRLQSEKLRVILKEQRNQQVAALLRKMEWEALYVLSRKDEEIAHAAKKTVELEEFLTRLELENQSWQRVAHENEARVLSLHNTLEQMKERAPNSCCFNNGYGYGYGVAAEDAESCCDQSRAFGVEEENEERTGENKEGCDAEQITRKRVFVCKACNSRSSCFLFLPCRHLCSCKACEPFLQACPVCGMPKKSAIETFIF